MKILVLKGLPASGKSTWAKEFVLANPGWKRISKDCLRDMLDAGKWSKKNEDVILEVRDVLVRGLVLDGYNVIIDDTNLHPKHPKRMQEIADIINAGGAVSVEVEEKFFDTPLMECIRRDALRPNPVGSKQIYGMWKQFLQPKPVEYDPGLPNAIIVDLDGTLAIHNGRSPYNYDKIHTDVVDFDILMLVTILSQDHQVVVVSGRPDDYRLPTEVWLEANNVPWDVMHMRPAGDNREDSIVKKEIYENHIKDVCNVMYVFDDRDRVVSMWRDLGLRCLQVNYGPF